ncbi:MAG: phospholipase D-like domain-containing protein [Candidatus Micrarchaeia archaeon]
MEDYKKNAENDALKSMTREFYNGINSYKVFEKMVKDSTALFLISPFVDEPVLNLLNKMAKSKRIYLITTYRNLNVLKKYSKKNYHIKVVLFLILAACASLLLDAFIVFLAFLLMAFVVVLVGTKQKARLNIRVYKRVFHEKIYIAKDSALVGSMNLTDFSMHKNIEYTEIIKDKETISKLMSHFNSMWHSSKKP